MPLKTITSYEEFSDLEQGSGLVVIHFTVDWALQCWKMYEVLKELSKQSELKDVTFAVIPAEDLSEVSLKFNITAAPTFILLKGGLVVDRVEGANATELTTKVKTQAAKLLSGVPPAAPVEDLNSRLKRLINSAKCILFMKGSPNAPKCGFSRTTVELLAKHEVDYSSFDILTDEKVRQGLKAYSNWPTYPQLYIDGELVGGLDILKEMDSSGELAPMLATAKPLNDRLKTLIESAPLMVFMKGDRDTPKCDHSRIVIGILDETKLPYDTFDILTDEEVRDGLRKLGNYATYPQVYVKRERLSGINKHILIGGFDEIKELQRSGKLMSTLKDE